ncbi:hypothetical protein COLO4_18491 [Corchorus olitorius]|uniref:Uncharacterized protein n=1 Tax=Corchorus olitorius TaxID=93759 RepID=A0A1R3J914_9ROSI|nr:hypothetical protein COLO4_18491 [Corchorus olitorius]
MTAFLNCLSLNKLNNEKCVRQKELLSTCMDAQFLCYLNLIHHDLHKLLLTLLQTNSKRKAGGSINYHLQRLNRGRK